ncbi:hypothetical protein V3C99_000838, partial [Haemonchus contortus]
MLRLLLFVLCLSGLIPIGYARVPSCFLENYIKNSCKRRVIIAIDDATDGLQRREEEYSIANSILQRLDIREDFISVALATYG